MKPHHALAGALLLALVSVAGPASAQIADSARPEAMIVVAPEIATAKYNQKYNCRRCRPSESRVTQAGPLDIRTAPQIVQTALRYVGARNPTGFRGPWCKAFVNMIARQSGHYVNASLRAFDTALMGARISHPVPGAYRVNARRGGGHVSIVAAVHGGTVEAVSGNGRGHRVHLAHYRASGALYYLPM